MNLKTKLIGLAMVVTVRTTMVGAETSLARDATPIVSSTADTGAALEEIVVTAQRREEGVQHAALAIDVVSSKSLELTGANRASDLAALVPALQIGESGNSQQSLYLRSVGTFSTAAYSDPAVAFNVDGVALARTSSMSGVMYDLSRIEVLKGPQGTLYGRNATGGAINIIPSEPKIGENSGEISLSVGNYGEVHPEADVNLAINEQSAARLALTYTRHDGYQSDGTGDANGGAGRAQYLYQFTDDLSVRIAGDYAHDGGHGNAGTIIAIQNPFTGVITPSALSRDIGNLDSRAGTILSHQYSFIAGRYLQPIEGPAKTDNDFGGVLAQLDWKTPWGTLTVLPAHRQSRLNDLTTGFAYAGLSNERDEQSSLEARFASPNEGLVRWLVGGYLFHETIDAVYQFNQEALAPIQDLNTGTLSKAGFGRLTIAPTDEFRISIGVRYTNDYKTFDGNDSILVSACGAPAFPVPACPDAPLVPNASSVGSYISKLKLVPIVPNALYASTLPGAAASVFPLLSKPIDQARDFTRTTYHAGLEYDLTPHSLVYANWDTGYHAGGFAFASIKPTYEPEYLSAYSLGSKNRFLNDTIEFNAEAFYWKYTNQQIPHGGTDTDGTYVFYTDNAGASTIKGGEVSVKYVATKQTVVSVDAQYLSAVYTRFTYQTPAGGTNAPPLTGCPYTQTDAAHYTVDCAGSTAQQAPRWSGNLSVQQRAKFGDYSIVGEISAHAQSSSMVGFELINSETQKAYAETNLTLGLSPSGDKWSVVAFVNNLNDKRPYGTAYYNSVASLISATVGAPRTEGVRANYKF